MAGIVIEIVLFLLFVAVLYWVFITPEHPAAPATPGDKPAAGPPAGPAA
ncbi:MAG: hypothetical protein ABIF71_05385 [Planctomycetota bacterium]